MIVIDSSIQCKADGALDEIFKNEKIYYNGIALSRKQSGDNVEYSHLPYGHNSFINTAKDELIKFNCVSQDYMVSEDKRKICINFGFEVGDSVLLIPIPIKMSSDTQRVVSYNHNWYILKEKLSNKD